MATLTDGYIIHWSFRYSGSDIANMVNDALMAPVRTIDQTKTWVEVNDNGKVKYAPFDESL